MSLMLDKQHPVVRLRAFRAVDDPKACELFLKGHEQVLTSIGVKKVTSSKNEWMTNPSAFVLIVESLDKEKVYGGARIQVADGKRLLPIEEATGGMDSGIFQLVWQYAQQGTGEICGLWNSREIAGYGVGSIFLTRAAVAISTQIGIRSLFALCAPYTVKMAESVGYQIETSVGNDGTFYYPKLDLLATTMLLENVNDLAHASPENKEAIDTIRRELNVVRLEQLRKKEIEIHYEAELPLMDRWSLDEIIKNYYKANSGNHSVPKSIDVL
ncbi:hypothetical protein [Parapedobacter soli]|uniref:hypothetical protein n=1 Tax=Parapedobacter soli TaxID=416955 RepID=UPI0021C7F667|nr:hypothetical protein [Parapedobacter soli]